MPAFNTWTKRITLVAVAGFIVLGIAMPHQAADANRAGREKADVCAPCHGADGNSVSPAFPRIAGQHASYLIVALNNYRSGARQNPIMGGIAKSLQNDDITDLANYYASLPGLLSTLPRN